MLENRSATVNAPSLGRSLDAELPSRQRARRTNDPFAEISTKTARGRRVADLVRAYLRALGNPAGVERQASVIAAAELQVLAEEARTAALKETGCADLDQVIRMQGAADRAVRRLGLDRKREPAALTLAEYLSAQPKAAEEDEESDPPEEIPPDMPVEDAGDGEAA